MHLFHYHLVTSKVREVEARYVGKLGFTLVARHGRIGEDTTSFEAGYGWDDLDRMGFKLRLTELERGAVNVVVQPGQWELPRVDHLGVAHVLAREQRLDVVHADAGEVLLLEALEVGARALHVWLTGRARHPAARPRAKGRRSRSPPQEDRT